MSGFNDHEEGRRYRRIEGWEHALDFMGDGWKALYDCTEEDMVDCGGCRNEGNTTFSTSWFAWGSACYQASQGMVSPSYIADTRFKTTLVFFSVGCQCIVAPPVGLFSFQSFSLPFSALRGSTQGLPSGAWTYDQYTLRLLVLEPQGPSASALGNTLTLVLL